jgi:YHS domain-containing protein
MRFILICVAIYLIFRVVSRIAVRALVAEGKRRFDAAASAAGVHQPGKVSGDRQQLVEAVCDLNIPKSEAIEFKRLDGKTVYLCEEDCKTKCLNQGR